MEMRSFALGLKGPFVWGLHKSTALIPGRRSDTRALEYASSVDFAARSRSKTWKRITSGNPGHTLNVNSFPQYGFQGLSAWRIERSTVRHQRRESKTSEK